jgi:hypothetical protein
LPLPVSSFALNAPEKLSATRRTPPSQPKCLNLGI